MKMPNCYRKKKKKKRQWIKKTPALSLFADRRVSGCMMWLLLVNFILFQNRAG